MTPLAKNNFIPPVNWSPIWRMGFRLPYACGRIQNSMVKLFVLMLFAPPLLLTVNTLSLPLNTPEPPCVSAEYATEPHGLNCAILLTTDTHILAELVSSAIAELYIKNTTFESIEF